MTTIKIHIDDEARKAVKRVYGKDDYATVECVVNNIINRYLNIDHFDPELSVESDCYTMCTACKEKAKAIKMIDVDGENLEEHEVCQNCGAGCPALK